MMRIVIILLITVFFISADNSPKKYAGVDTCKLCHKGKKDGYQYEIWQKSKHAGAFKTLRTKQSEDIAKKMGLNKSASESRECIECHAVNDEKLKEDGVQCESCHGAGSIYKSRKVMKNREACVAAGMTEYKDEEAIKKSCESCHNKKSPTYKPFDFKSSWKEIEHPVP